MPPVTALISRLLLLLCLIAAPLAALQAEVDARQSLSGLTTSTYPGTMQIEVDATDIDRAIFHVRQTIPVGQVGTIALRYPEWLPGNHGPRGEIEKLAGLTFTANARQLTWRRDPKDLFTFLVDVPQGTNEITARFDFLSAMDSSSGRVLVSPAMLNLRWQHLSLYPAGYAVSAIPVSARATFPQGWAFASSLDVVEQRGQQVRFAASSYEQLIDSPVFAGRNVARHDLGHGIRLNLFADSPGALEASKEQIAAHRRLADETIALFGPPPFARYEFLVGLTDVLSEMGLEHRQSSENIVDPGYFTRWALGPGRRMLLPHELAHAWNGKYHVPEGLARDDYHSATDPGLLWVYEGLSQYHGVVLAARSGLWSQQEALDAIAATAAEMSGRAGRTWRPLADTVYDPVMASPLRRDWPSWQRSQDYYNEALLIWLEVDQLIRKGSDGNRSLDDFTRSFFAVRAGDDVQKARAYGFDRLIETLNDIHPQDWRAFFDQRLNRPAEAPLSGITLGGYQLARTTRRNSAVMARDLRFGSRDYSHSIGIVVSSRGRVESVRWDSAAFRAGIAPTDRITMVRGAPFTLDEFETALTQNGTDGRPLLLDLQRNDRARQLTVDYRSGLVYPALTKTKTTETGLDRLLQPLRPPAD